MAKRGRPRELAEPVTRMTITLGADHVIAMDALVAAGQHRNRAEVLRSLVDRHVLELEEILDPVVLVGHEALVARVAALELRWAQQDCPIAEPWPVPQELIDEGWSND